MYSLVHVLGTALTGPLPPPVPGSMWWFQRGVCALPAALVTWSLATFVVSYVTAVLLGHVDLLVPYIRYWTRACQPVCVCVCRANLNFHLVMH